MNENLQNSNIASLLDSFAKLLLISVSFLVPIFFLPVTLEFYQFNKLALIVIATLLIVICWAAKILLGQKMGFTKSMLDLPLLAYVLVVVLATFFSLNKVDSVWGSSGRWVGLFSLLVFVAYFFLSTPVLKDLKTIKTALYAFLASSTISTIASLLSYFKVYLSNEAYMKVPNFNLTGSTTDTVFLAAVGVIIAFGLIAYEEFQPAKPGLIISVLINFFFIFLVRLPIGFVVLGTGLIGFLMYADLGKVSKSKFFYGITTLLLVASVLVTLIPLTRSVLINNAYPKETLLPIKESWLVASSIIQSYPMLATGPATFYLNFSRFRPLSLNGTDYWNTRFDMPKNEFFYLLSTLGVVGLIVGLFLVSKILKFVNSVKLNQDESGLSPIISAVVLAMLVGYLFTFTTIMNTFMLVAMLSFLVATHALTDKQVKLSEAFSFEADVLSSLAGTSDASVIKKEYYRYFASVPMLLLATFVGYLGFKNYAGEYYMRQSLTAAAKNDGKGTYDFQRMAITLNPNRDTYQTTYAQTNLVIANSIASRQNLTDTDKQTVQALIAQSIRSVRIATEVVGPLNPANWETRAFIYRSLINVAQNATDWTVGAYNTAIQLDPSNPRLRVDLGGVYFQTADYLSAANQFRQASMLKGDYANAYYNFANALIMLKDYQNAKTALETTKTLVPQGSEDMKTVDNMLTSVSAQLAQVAGASTSKPTVEQIAGTENKGQKTQEPLTNPGQAQQPVENENLNLGKLPQPKQPQQPAQ